LHGWAITPFASFTVRVDSLAAFFLPVSALPAVAVSVYGLSYLNWHHGGTQDLRPPARAATDGLVAAFLAAMSLVSFFLVLGNGHNRDTRRAAYVYVVMTQVATCFLVFAFLLLAREAMPGTPRLQSADFVAILAAATTDHVIGTADSPRRIGQHHGFIAQSH
jgi:formate hydrogenlyase subunit 3/multisubunit Na+/H+ antiporter MnhD subunit